MRFLCTLLEAFSLTSTDAETHKQGRWQRPFVIPPSVAYVSFAPMTFVKDISFAIFDSPENTAPRNPQRSLGFIQHLAV